MNIDRMEAQLLLHEGERLTAYRDTVGKWTVFVGYNLSARGVGFLRDTCGREFPWDVTSVKGTRKESRLVLRADIHRLDNLIPHRFPLYLLLDDVRQRVVLDMAFNLGTKALDFKRTIAAAAVGDYAHAADYMLESKWARQVGARAERLANMVRTGLDYTT